MVNTILKFQSPAALAEYLDNEAARIRARVSRASASSQHIMRAEAAAYERTVRLIRNLEIAETEAA